MSLEHYQEKLNETQRALEHNYAGLEEVKQRIQENKVQLSQSHHVIQNMNKMLHDTDDEDTDIRNQIQETLDGWVNVAREVEDDLKQNQKLEKDFETHIRLCEYNITRANKEIQKIEDEQRRLVQERLRKEEQRKRWERLAEEHAEKQRLEEEERKRLIEELASEKTPKQETKKERKERIAKERRDAAAPKKTTKESHAAKIERLRRENIAEIEANSRSRMEAEEREAVQREARTREERLGVGVGNACTLSREECGFIETLQVVLGDYIRNESSRNTCDIEFEKTGGTLLGIEDSLQSLLEKTVRENLKSESFCVTSIYHNFDEKYKEDKQALLDELRVCIYGRILQQYVHTCYNVKAFVRELLSESVIIKEKYSNLVIKYFGQLISIPPRKWKNERHAPPYWNIIQDFRHLNVIHQLHSLHFLLKHVRSGVEITTIKWNSYDTTDNDNRDELFHFEGNEANTLDLFEHFMKTCMYNLYERFFTLTFNDGTVMRVTPSPRTDIYEYNRNLKTYFTHMDTFHSLKETSGQLLDISDLLYHHYMINNDYFQRESRIWNEFNIRLVQTRVVQMNDSEREQLKKFITRLFTLTSQNIYYYAAHIHCIWFESIQSQQALQSLHERGEITNMYYEYFRQLHSYPVDYTP